MDFKNKTSSIILLLGLTVSPYLSGCEEECPAVSDSSLYASCEDDSDCGCITLEDSSWKKTTRYLTCEPVINSDKSLERICTTECAYTKQDAKTNEPNCEIVHNGSPEYIDDSECGTYESVCKPKDF